jgi:hypothetical protein
VLGDYRQCKSLLTTASASRSPKAAQGGDDVGGLKAAVGVSHAIRLRGPSSYSVEAIREAEAASRAVPAPSLAKLVVAGRLSQTIAVGLDHGEGQ